MNNIEPSSGSKPPQADDEVGAIRRVLTDAERFQNEVDALMALHAEGTVIVNIAGRRVLGRGRFRQAMQTALASPLANVRTSIEIEDVRFVRSDVAIVSCTKHVSDERDDATRNGPGAVLPSSGALTYVLSKEKGAWRIALAQTTPIQR